MTNTQMIIHNGIIHTMDPARPSAEAVAVVDGVIVGVGGFAELSDQYSGYRRIDLDGRTLVPGFNDCHMHVLPYGLDLSKADLSPSAGVTDVPSLIARLQRWKDDNASSAWVLGSRYDHNTFPGAQHPTRYQLDAAFPDHPVYIMQTSKHGGTANSAALKIAGIDRNTSDPDGGEIVRDANGEPTGVVLENALGLITQHIPQPDKAALVNAIHKAEAALVREGVTSATDMNVGWFDLEQEIESYLSAAQAGAPIRMSLFPHLPAFGPPENIPSHSAFASRFADGHDQVRLGCGKLFSDGALTVRTAALREPYVDGSGSGMLLHQPEELFSYIRSAHSKGWNIAVHAIGDRATELVLDGFLDAQQAFPRTDTRHRIEHAMILDDALIQRFVSQNVTPVLQSEFLARLGDAYVLGLGLARASKLNRASSLLSAGLPVPLSSDCPIVPGAPLDGIRAAVYRTTRKGLVLGREESMTCAQALRGYTEWAAYSVCDEGQTGSIKPGLRADFAVLSHDIVASDEDLQAARVVGTIIGGKVVFGHSKFGHEI